MNLYNFTKKYSISKPLFITYFTFLVLIIYFIFMIFFGQKGLVKYYSLKNEIQNQEISKKELESQIDYKKIKVEGMNPSSLDLDLLDEEARKNLGYSSKNEVIIYQDNKKENAK